MWSNGEVRGHTETPATRLRSSETPVDSTRVRSLLPAQVSSRCWWTVRFNWLNQQPWHHQTLIRYFVQIHLQLWHATSFCLFSLSVEILVEVSVNSRCELTDWKLTACDRITRRAGRSLRSAQLTSRHTVPPTQRQTGKGALQVILDQDNYFFTKRGRCALRSEQILSVPWRLSQMGRVQIFTL